jgi:chromate transporter
MLILVAVFIAIGVLKLPLQAVLLVAIPASLVITWYWRMRGER